MQTAIKIIDRTTDIVLVLFFLLIFLIGGYTMYDTLLIYNAAEGEDLRRYKPNIVNGEASWDMNELSSDVVAWLTVDGTTIDYPVMQGRDNNEYLNKDPFGNYSLAGSLFLDSRNTSDFSDEYSLIYGHHMEYGHMFGALDNFVDKNYFDSHRIGTLTVGNKVYKITFFACTEADGAEEAIFVPDSAEDALNYTKENAIIWYEPIANGGRILALSTCKFPQTTERLIVFGVINDA